MSLARALTIDAPIIILDDCLASVDNQTASEILKNFSNAQGKTIVFISHQLSAAAKADRIFVMEKGEIVQIGTHSELVEQTGLYRFLWQQNQLEKILQ
jgi:ATP-binding cassette subfamily B protein